MGWEWTLPEDINSKMPTPIHSEVGILGTFDNPAENKRHSEPNNSKMPTQTYMDTFETATPMDTFEMATEEAVDTLKAGIGGVDGENQSSQGRKKEPVVVDKQWRF